MMLSYSFNSRYWQHILSPTDEIYRGNDVYKQRLIFNSCNNILKNTDTSIRIVDKNLYDLDNNLNVICFPCFHI